MKTKINQFPWRESNTYDQDTLTYKALTPNASDSAMMGPNQYTFNLPKNQLPQNLSKLRNPSLASGMVSSPLPQKNLTQKISLTNQIDEANDVSDADSFFGQDNISPEGKTEIFNKTEKFDENTVVDSSKLIQLKRNKISETFDTKSMRVGFNES